MRLIGLLFLIGLSAAFANAEVTDSISLTGPWRFSLDPGNAGMDAHWESRDLAETVNLPGSLDENGKGTPNEKASPSFLSRAFEYVGAAWYQRDVEIPAEWNGRPLEIFLERCHWESRLWVDGRAIDMQDSLCTPHVYTLGALPPGPHRLTLRIDNSVKYNVGLRAPSITEHTQTNWNGVVGRMELRALLAVRLGAVDLYPSAKGRSLIVKCIVQHAPQPGGATLTVSVLGVSEQRPISWASEGETPVEITLQLGKDAPLWEPSNPHLLDLDLALTLALNGKPVTERQRIPFGLRDIGRDGAQLTLNGHPFSVRGTLECCIFPLTGYPAMDRATWLRMMQTAREYGLNHFRFHSWCPPEAAFDAADETGMTLQVETPVWTDLGKDPAVDQYIRDEADRILALYGNHPSFTMLCVGNEPSGPKKDLFLTDIVKDWQDKDNRRLYTTCSGWPELPLSDFHVVHERSKIPYRLHGGPLLAPNTAKDYSDVLAGSERPAIAHELGQWCVYPDYEEITKYTGLLHPRNLEGFRDSLRSSGMLGQAPAFARASGRLQRLMYKADIEAILRSPGAGGFQLLSLQDFPGQGSALVGFLDALWNSKGAVTPDQFRQFCSDTVPLLRLDKFVWTAEETLTAHAEIAHYGTAPIVGARPFWTARLGNGKEIGRGDFAVRDIPIGNGTFLGDINFPLNTVPAAAKVTLTVALPGTAILNTWDVWVYPQRQGEADCGQVQVFREWCPELSVALHRGARVLLAPRNIAPKYRVKSAFEPIFWNTQWFPGQNRQLGILCDPQHPAFAGFPNDGCTDWQWWELLNQSVVARLEAVAPGFRPLVQVIDDWNKNRLLGAVFEARVDKGRLLVCTLDIDTALSQRPAADALRRSLLRYMNSPDFAPATEMAFKDLRRMFSGGESPIAQVEADSAAPGYPPENAVDGDRDTVWHTPWENSPPTFPHALKILFHREISLIGLRYVPRQDVPNGRTGNYEVYAAKDGRNWGTAIATGTLDGGAAQEIHFPSPVCTRWLRFVALNNPAGEPFTSIAELEPLTQGN